MSGMIAACLGALMYVAGAPGDSDADDRGRARALFEEAGVAKKEARWQDVRRLLEQSLELYPQFSTAWNLVTADEQLDDLPAAEALLLGMQGGRYGALDDKERAAVVERLTSISKELGTIALEVGEAAVKVSVDGKPRGEVDPAGRAVLRVPSGTHVVAVSSIDGRTMERSIDVARSESRTLRFTFVAPGERGRLIVEAEDPGRSIAIDGVTRGVGRIDLSLEPKIYQVGLAGEEEVERVTLKAGQTAQVRLEQRTSVVQGPWMWIGIGVVVVAGAVTAAVLASQSRDPLPADFVAPPL